MGVQKKNCVGRWGTGGRYFCLFVCLFFCLYHITNLTGGELMLYRDYSLMQDTCFVELFSIVICKEAGQDTETE